MEAIAFRGGETQKVALASTGPYAPTVAKAICLMAIAGHRLRHAAAVSRHAVLPSEMATSGLSDHTAIALTHAVASAKRPAEVIDACLATESPRNPKGSRPTKMALVPTFGPTRGQRTPVVSRAPTQVGLPIKTGRAVKAEGRRLRPSTGHALTGEAVLALRPAEEVRPTPI